MSEKTQIKNLTLVQAAQSILNDVVMFDLTDDKFDDYQSVMGGLALLESKLLGNNHNIDDPGVNTFIKEVWKVK